MIAVAHLRRYVVRPTLEAMGLWSEAAEELVMGTAAQESRLAYLRQLGGGPAIGLWQMEPSTHDDILINYLPFRPELTERVLAVTGLRRMDSRHLVAHLGYGAAMCRVHYRRVPSPLPDADDVLALARYWKDYYNTALGAGTVEEYIDAYIVMRRAESGQEGAVL